MNESGFDPYTILGVGADADAVVIQLAYKARIRAVHPDIAGAAGLEHTKRLNAARDWLLDPHLRAQLRTPGPGWPNPAPTPEGAAPGRRARGGQRSRTQTADDPTQLDPFTYDFGPRAGELRDFFHSIGSLSRDERARVNYSLGETRPVYFADFDEYLEPRLWSRSRALRDAVSMVWGMGRDEEAPFVSPLGRVLPQGFLVANAYAQWILQSDFLRRELRDGAFRSGHVIDTFAARCIDPWRASVRQPRYGPHQQRVVAFLYAASSLPVEAAERLARSWRQHMAQDEHGDVGMTIGPGVWLPAPSNYPEILKVSGYLAAVDASRIEPPSGLDASYHDGFRYGVRLTGHVTALGLTSRSSPDYLRPWRDATGADRSVWRKLRSRA